ncbi:hypothetical protein A374_12990 [Fictibacillus macauensis ZFHKF-1]|uniref:UPF0180 protein A374_12990 n=1 Tax=Fictibacillus macauensis ZFHKF-1 TaxID=1196324 RepID=I8UDV1_9BACL|nr:YkuS family protein [Fictibacillus macauensis]EIT84963.1 hypothetical protein A374_12990 [Fictibacillus macauensis ZFHKF-1]
MAKIGVEQSLTNVSDALKAMGHEVVTITNEQDAKGCDCCIVSGAHQNMMGIQNVLIDGAVVNADGMNAEDVCRAVEGKLPH